MDKNKILIKAIINKNIRMLERGGNLDHPQNLIKGVNVVEIVGGEPVITKTILFDDIKKTFNENSIK